MMKNMTNKYINKFIAVFLGLFLLAIAVSAIAAIEYEWQTATQREDNTALGLSEIQGHRVYCGPEIGDYSYQPTFHPGATLPNTKVTTEDLPDGTHYCVITTVDIDDRESRYSNYITITVDAQSDPKAPYVPVGTTINVVVTVPSGG